MNNIVQRLVSGNRARLRDKELNIELDLTYINDKLIVMAYPGDGLQAYYRNHRSDAQKFLTTKHGSDFWVFNFCPVAENSYDKSIFGGRVSRYPFPDHHAPPLALLALAANEIRRWIQSSPKRVAVLHCKAGKGRSGTLACAYLLSLENIPGKPQPSQTHIETRANELIESMPSDEEEGVQELVREETPSHLDPTLNEEPKGGAKVDHSPNLAENNESLTQSGEGAVIDNKPDESSPSGMAAVETILDLHTSKRIKPGSKGRGVSIPSQRRWLHYYARVLSGDSPSGFWSLSSTTLPPPSERRTAFIKRIRVTLGPSTLAHAANTLLRSRAPKLWAVAARYEDELVGSLENAYRDLVRMQEQLQDKGSADAGRVFTEDPKWDKGRMVWRFARFRGVKGAEKKVVLNEGGAKEEKETVTETELIPDGSFVSEDGGRVSEQLGAKDSLSNHSEGEPDFTDTDNEELAVASGLKRQKSKSRVASRDVSAGIAVDPNREVRIKLLIGRVPLGWIWIIPVFHRDGNADRATIRLGGQDVDFAFGVGGEILAVEIDLEFRN